jgi:hypothetical protein
MKLHQAIAEHEARRRDLLPTRCPATEI